MTHEGSGGGHGRLRLALLNILRQPGNRFRSLLAQLGNCTKGIGSETAGVAPTSVSIFVRSFDRDRIEDLLLALDEMLSRPDAR